VDNDHYCPSLIYTSGKHELPNDTRYLRICVRIKVFDPKDKEEIALVNKLQDQFVIEAGKWMRKPATSLRRRAKPPGRHQGWNFLMRIYRPGKSTLDGSYKLPAAQSTSSCWVSCCHG